MATEKKTSYGYDKEKDYMALMDQAVAGGDLQSAAIYEQQRNQKVNDLNAAGTNAKGHVTTDKYSGYLPGASEESDTFKSSYSDTINNLLSGLQNDKFSYDFDSDPQKASYEKDAQGNFDNTLAQVSARTGGLSSSYGGQASQQAYQDTMDNAYQLLRGQALDEWNSNRADQYNLLSAMQGLDNTDYSRFADQRSYDYQVGRDAVSDERYDAESEKAALSDKAALMAEAGNFSGYQNLYGLSDSQIAGLNTAYAKDDQKELAELMAQYGMYDELVSVLGGTEADAQKLNAAYQAANIVSYSGGGSSGSGSQQEDDPAWQSAREKMYQSGVSYDDAYNWLIDAGYSKDEATEIATGYTSEWVQRRGQSDGTNLGVAAQRVLSMIDEGILTTEEQAERVINTNTAMTEEEKAYLLSLIA